ncbi:MAG: hypothetical protein REI45_14680, partial [Propionicimonas sp.]|nr:hypothetical protein [Propionicimonas sp.]
GGLLQVTVADGQLALAAGGIAGTLAASVAAAATGFTLGADVVVQLNTHPAAWGGLPGGPYLRVVARDATITVAGQVLSATVTLVRSGVGATAIDVTVSGGRLSLGGPAAGVDLSDGSGHLAYTAAGLAGSLGGTVAVRVPGVHLSGTLRLSLDTAAGTLGFAGTGIVATVLGQSLSGSFAFASSPTGLTIEVQQATLSFGGGVVGLRDGRAQLVLPTGGQLSGSVTGTVAVTLPGVALQGTVTAELDAAAAAPAPTLRIGGSGLRLLVAGVTLAVASLWFSQDAAGTIRLAVDDAALGLGPTGQPYLAVSGGDAVLVVTAAGVSGTLAAQALVRVPGLVETPSPVAVGIALDTAAGQLAVTVTGLVLQFGALGQISGDFAFSQSRVAGITETVVAFSGATASVASGGASITEGTGVLVLRPGGVAGYLSGHATIATGPAAGEGSVLLRVNTIVGAAVDTAVVLGGQTVAVKYPAAPETLFALAITGGSLKIGDFVSIEGSISFDGDRFAGTGLKVFLGSGPAILEDGSLNPLAVGVLLSEATIGLLRVGSSYALVATGTVSILGVPGITLTGTTSVRYNQTGTDQTTTIEIPGDTPDVVLDVANGTASFAVVAATLRFGGLALTGGLEFSQAGGTTSITVTGGRIDLAGAATLHGVDGTVAMTAAGISASLAAGLDLAALGLTGLAVTVTVDTRPAATVPLAVSLSGLTLTIAGQQLTVGEFSLTSRRSGATATTTLRLTGASLSLAGGLVTAVIATGTLELAAGGVAGSMTATVATTLPGLALSAGVEIQVNTNPVATLGLPGGPYLRVSAAGATLAVAGQTLTAGIVIVRAGAELDLTLTGAGLTFAGGAVTLSNGSGQLRFATTGVSGTLAGTIAVAIPGVGVAGTLRLGIDTATQTLQFSGTDLSLALFGQALSGGVTISSTPTAVEIVVSDAAFSFGGGLVRLANGSARLRLPNGGAVSGSIRGTVTLAIPGVALAGTFVVELDGAAVAPLPTLRIGVPADAGNVTPELTLAVAGVELAVESLWFSQDASGTIRL